MSDNLNTPHPSRNHNLLILLVGIFGVFVTIGITRMSFGMLVPLIQENLSLSSTQIGTIGTANFIGYFVGAMFANVFYERTSLKTLMIWVGGIEIILVAQMAFSTHYEIIALCYAMIGVVSAIGYMSIMSYVVAHIDPAYKGRALGFAISGNSLGIVVSGISVYALLSEGNNSYGDNYLVFIVVMAISIVLITLGIKKQSSHLYKPRSTMTTKAIALHPNFLKMAAIYFIFSISYTIFLTYFTSHIIDHFAISISSSSNFWLILGVISLFSGVLFGFIADKFSTYAALSITYALQGVAAFLLVFSTASYAIVVSAFLFGIVLWSNPSLMFLLSTTYFGKSNTTKATALVTIVFGAGQVIGPITGGVSYDITGSYVLIFACVGVISLLACAMSIVFNAQLKKAANT